MAKAVTQKETPKQKILNKKGMKAEKTPKKEKLKIAAAKTPDNVLKGVTKSILKDSINSAKKGKKLNNENSTYKVNNMKESPEKIGVNGNNKTSIKNENGSPTPKLSKTLKRRLRRERKAAEKLEGTKAVAAKALSLPNANSSLGKLSRSQRKRLRRKKKREEMRRQQEENKESKKNNYLPLKQGDTKPPFTGKLSRGEKKKLQRARKAEAKKLESEKIMEGQMMTAKNANCGGQNRGQGKDKCKKKEDCPEEEDDEGEEEEEEEEEEQEEEGGEEEEEDEEEEVDKEEDQEREQDDEDDELEDGCCKPKKAKKCNKKKNPVEEDSDDDEDEDDYDDGADDDDDDNEEEVKDCGDDPCKKEKNPCKKEKKSDCDPCEKKQKCGADESEDDDDDDDDDDEEDDGDDYEDNDEDYVKNVKESSGDEDDEDFENDSDNDDDPDDDDDSDEKEGLESLGEGDAKVPSKKRKAKSDFKENEARKVRKSSSKAGEELTVFMGNVDFKATERDVREFVERVLAPDEIEEIELGKNPQGKPRGFGFLKVTTQEAFQKALQLNGEKLNNREVRMLKSEKRSDSRDSGAFRNNARGGFRGGFKGRGGGGLGRGGSFRGNSRGRGGGGRGGSNFNERKTSHQGRNFKKRPWGNDSNRNFDKPKKARQSDE